MDKHTSDPCDLWCYHHSPATHPKIATTCTFSIASSLHSLEYSVSRCGRQLPINQQATVYGVFVVCVVWVWVLCGCVCCASVCCECAYVSNLLSSFLVQLPTLSTSPIKKLECNPIKPCHGDASHSGFINGFIPTLGEQYFSPKQEGVCEVWGGWYSIYTSLIFNMQSVNAIISGGPSIYQGEGSKWTGGAIGGVVY